MICYVSWTEQTVLIVLIKLTTSFPEWPLERQTPGKRGIWRDCRFLINENTEACDFWVVYDDLLLPETVLCNSVNTLLITAEPPSIKNYPTKFIEQFSSVVSCHRNINHRNLILRHQAQPWHIGRRQLNHKNIEFKYDYDELVLQDVFTDKKKLISVIVSDKSMSAGHKRRLRLLKGIAEHFGDRLDVYGHGFREIEDKWEAIRQYKYHIVMENSRIPDYWTEKLADAYLGGAFPLYFGSPNIIDYFPPDSLAVLQDDIPAAIKTIESTINMKKFEHSLIPLQKARDLVLNHYNLFPEIRSICLRNYFNNTQLPTTLFPSSFFRNSFSSWIRQHLTKILTAGYQAK